MPSLGHWKIPQIRSGRRSISVGKLLEKERLGTLFKKHAYKLDGETTFQGLDIAIENDVGSTRSGRDADGSRWSIKYRTPYGYLRGTEGADGEEVDCYVGRDADADKAYVVHQKADDGSYDEDTVMLGYGSQAAAKSDILRHYSDPKYVGKIVPIAMERLKELVDSKKKLVKISAIPQVFHPAIDRIFGIEEIHHGTSAEAADAISREGLDPTHGGLHTSRVLGDQGSRLEVPGELRHQVIDDSKGKVFVTPNRSVAHLYAENHGGSGGKVVSGLMPAEDFARRFTKDGFEELAYKSTQKVGPEVFNATREQLVRDRLRNPRGLLSHMTKNPGQVAAGVLSGAFSAPGEALHRAKKLMKFGFATKDPEYVEGDPIGTAGLPALPRKRRGDVPSRDEVELNPTPKVESRGNNMETHLVGEFHSPGGNDDLGKFGAALSELGAMSEDWEGDPDVGLSLATAREKELRGPDPFRTLSEVTPVDDSLKMAMVRHAFLEELTKIAEEHGAPPWAGAIEDFERYVEAFQKEAFGAAAVAHPLAGIGQAVKGAVGRLLPAASAVHPDVAAMRKGVGFFSTGMGKDLSAGGKMLAHNPQAAGRAAGLGTKELGSLQAMKPTTAGRRIAGETAMGAGHHMQHAGPGLMAMNPMGVPMGGAIEGFTRGVGKELQGAGHQGVQAAGRALVKHAPKVGFGGELVAGGLLHTPGLAAQAGHHLAPMAHAATQHLLGAGFQEASMAAPRALPRLGGALGQAAMGLKARAGHWGGKLVGA